MAQAPLPSKLLENAEPAESAELFDVPAAVVCALCGRGDCSGCSDQEEYTQGSGVVAIVPWERPGSVRQRLWETAKQATLNSEAFFAALPEGAIAPALGFAVLAELLAVAGLSLLLGGTALALVPEAIVALRDQPDFRDLVLRVIAIGVPSTALTMVAVHLLHGAGLDWGARRAGSSRKFGRGLRFGLYACGWDFVTLPLGILMLCREGGISRGLKSVPLGLTVPKPASMAYLRGVHRLSVDAATRASRFAVLVALGIFVGFASFAGVGCAILMLS